MSRIRPRISVSVPERCIKFLDQYSVIYTQGDRSKAVERILLEAELRTLSPEEIAALKAILDDASD